MDETEFPVDFVEFLRLLSEHHVEFILFGGFAVAFHGYPRATADLGVWVERSDTNAGRIVAALRAFGFDTPDLSPSLLLDPGTIVRMGEAPLRIEIMNDIDGVTFAECAGRVETLPLDGAIVPVISLADLKTNKRSSGRAKDLDDLENLP